MASSSSTIDCQVDYDVFLSFRGEDTRYNFTSHLYDNLCRKNIKAFIDYNIRRGEEITPFLAKIIEGVKLSIIVFSSGYASSTFCLAETVKIMECKNTKAQTVLPIFYKVYPSEETYQEAFTTHRANFNRRKRLREETVDQETMEENSKSFFRKALHSVISYWRASERHGEEIKKQEMKVEKWKSSLDEAFNLAGWHIHDYDDEAKSIESITTDVLEKLNCEFEGEMKSTPMVGQTSEDYLEKKIMQCLMNNENPKVGVWGMGGVGKTTLVTHINNRLRNSFSRHIYWVTVSKDSSVYKLQRDIAEVIKLDFSGEDNESKRAAKLFNKLKRINKFVMILDDVWEAFETEDVGIPPTGGRKLLLTTRYLGVCQRMMCQPIEVKPLSLRDAMVLFMKESKNQINDCGEWREIEQCIVKECGGLPLAIVVVARRMRGVAEISRWRNILRALQMPWEGENKELEKKVYNPLRFSYDHLPNDRCRQCFLYCSLFPEDYLFRRDDLIEYWIGKGLIDELDCRQAELDKGNVILDELIDSSLLEYIGRFERIKMHDVIRDMARIIVKIGLQFHDPLENVEVLNYRTTSERFPNSAPQSSKLKTLVLQGMYMMELSIPGCFFDNMQSLNVLHIKSVKSIPNCITHLGNLRLLFIDSCSSLECIPSLVGLEKLRHLRISSNHNLKHIPEGIERLVNLRVLDLSKNLWLTGSFPTDVVENLSHLQTLDLSGSRVEVEAKALISLEKVEIVRVQFFNVQKLNFYVKSGHWRKLLDYQINYGINASGRKGMCLGGIREVEEWKGESGIFIPDDVQNLILFAWGNTMFNVFKKSHFAHLQTITINEYDDTCLFTIPLAQHLLHNVQQLSIEFCIDLEEIIATEEECVNRSNYINCPTIVLPNLKILILGCLRELRSIYRGRMVCPSLELIQIYDCDNVKRLPFCLEKEGNTRNQTIILRGHLGEEDPVSRKWWNLLQWDNQNSKSMYHPKLSNSEHESSLDPYFLKFMEKQLGL